MCYMFMIGHVIDSPCEVLRLLSSINVRIPIILFRVWKCEVDRANKNGHIVTVCVQSVSLDMSQFRCRQVKQIL